MEGERAERGGQSPGRGAERGETAAFLLGCSRIRGQNKSGISHNTVAMQARKQRKGFLEAKQIMLLHFNV